MSILTENLPKNRLNLDGVTVKKAQRLDQVRELLKQSPLTPSEVSQKIGISRTKVYTDYIKPLVEAKEVTKIEGTGRYHYVTEKFTRKDVQDQLYEESEIMQTSLMKNWTQNNHSKGEHHHKIRFAHLCLGKVNPKFKIHPDSITKENWESVIVNAVNAIKEVTEKDRLSYSNRQVLRHAVMYGLDVSISEEKGIRLGIDGEKDEARVSDLHITVKQIEDAKKILKDEKFDKIWFVKFGFKAWTFARPSSIYIVKTDDLEFYDRTVNYVEVNGVKSYDAEVIKFANLLLSASSEMKNLIKIGSYTHRACKLMLFEHKTQSDYQKYIWDEEFVTALEKYHQVRKFQKKKYLFWDSNETSFTKLNYDSIVRTNVLKDNKFFQSLLLQIDFEKEDFGLYFRANYGFRHFGLQMWLQATGYDYDFVATMSHADTATLKKWYGKMSSEHFEKMANGVVYNG